MARKPPPLHLIKLSVGAESVEDLAAWQAARMAERRARGERDNPIHITRMFPKRGEELLSGGSIFWVIKGVILVRQKLVALESMVTDKGIKACRIVLDPKLIRTDPQPRRPFQGWRYFEAKDAPADIGPVGEVDDDIPETLLRELSALGLV